MAFSLTSFTQFICALHKMLKRCIYICAELTAASWLIEPIGEVDANFSLQLSSRTQFAKIKNKEFIVENQCEKHKKSSLSDTHRNLKHKVG